jgi:hypothetical protein
VKRSRHLGRVAVVGGSLWEKAAVKVFDALTPAECRYFGRGQVEQARAWLDAGCEAHLPPTASDARRARNQSRAIAVYR